MRAGALLGYSYESGALPDRGVLSKSHTGPGGEASRLNVPPGWLEPANVPPGRLEPALYPIDSLESHVH